MKTLSEVNSILQTIPEPWRYKWCCAEKCACVGCVQIGNRVIM